MRRRDGFAMVAAMLALLLVALFGSTMAELGRMELLLARNGTRLATGLAALDECAAAVTRSLPLGWDFDGVLAGPDGTPGTADDGLVAAPPFCVATAAPLPGLPARLLLDLEAARAGGRRAGRALIGRARTPGPPALLWIDAADRAGRVPGTMVLDGAAAGEPPWAGIAGPGDPTLLDAWIAAESGRARLQSPTVAPLWAPAPPLAAIVDAARLAGGAPPATALAPAAPAPELLGLAEGDLDVAGARWSRGVLIVTGRLRVGGAGTLTHEGLLVAAGGVDVATGGALAVRGAVWAGTWAPGAVDVAGALRVSADPAALERAATILTLPHEPRLIGWLDR